MAMAGELRPAAVATSDLPLIDDGAPPAPGWLFIPGLPRAGTTVLTEVLSAHPDAAVAREAWLWGYRAVLTTGRLDLEVVEERREHCWIENERMLRAVGSCVGDEPVWRASRLREFFEGLRRAVAPGAIVFGDKGPHYRGCLDELLTVFPGCRLVVCVRNTWDRAASMTQWGWFRGHHRELSPMQLAELAVAAAGSSLAGVDDLVRRGAYRLSFEGMATDQHTTLAALLGHLGLDPERYPWEYLQCTHYAQAVGHWQRVPEMVTLRERARAREQEGARG